MEETDGIVGAEADGSHHAELRKTTIFYVLSSYRAYMGGIIIDTTPTNVINNT